MRIHGQISAHDFDKVDRTIITAYCGNINHFLASIIFLLYEVRVFFIMFIYQRHFLPDREIKSVASVTERAELYRRELGRSKDADLGWNE